MSTHATYQFKDSHVDITFFIHYDGYPTGAAKYFQNMLDIENKMKSCNHSLAEVFFRANEAAEFANHNDEVVAHFHYLLGSEFVANHSNGYVLQVFRKYGAWHNHDRIFIGTIAEFIEKAKDIQENKLTVVRY